MPIPKYKNPALKSGVFKNLFKNSSSLEVSKLQILIKQKLKDPTIQKKAATLIAELLHKENKQ